LTVFLQQVAHYSAVVSGLALLPVTLIMFALSPVFGRLAGRHGPRLYMTVGPIIAAAGFALLTRLDAHPSYPTQMLPGVIVFGLGLAATVAPLTAAILGGIDERQAGIGSAINNAIARVAGLLAVAAIGAVISARYASAIDSQDASARAIDAPARAVLDDARRRPFDTAVARDAPVGSAERVKAILDTASEDALRTGLWSMAALLSVGGVISAVGIRKDRPHKGRGPERRQAEIAA
jgi:MFS family permease